MIQLIPTFCKPNEATYYTLYKDTADNKIAVVFILAKICGGIGIQNNRSVGTYNR